MTTREECETFNVRCLSAVAVRRIRPWNATSRGLARGSFLSLVTLARTPAFCNYPRPPPVASYVRASHLTTSTPSNTQAAATQISHSVTQISRNHNTNFTQQNHEHFSITPRPCGSRRYTPRHGSLPAIRHNPARGLSPHPSALWSHEHGVSPHRLLHESREGVQGASRPGVGPAPPPQRPRRRRRHPVAVMRRSRSRAGVLVLPPDL